MPQRHPTRPSSYSPERVRAGRPDASPGRRNGWARITAAIGSPVRRWPAWRATRIVRRFVAPTKRRWLRVTALVIGVPTVFMLVLVGYCYVRFGGMIDAQLGGDQRPIPRIFGRAFEIEAGAPLSLIELGQRLNDDGYAERPKAEHPGEFSTAAAAITLIPRDSAKSVPVRVDFSRGGHIVTKLSKATGGSVDHITLEAPLLSAVASGMRVRYVPLSAIPQKMTQAVLAIEDKRFFEHPGIDPIGVGGAVFSYVTGRHSYLGGGSTLTQQLVRNVFLPTLEGVTLKEARARSIRRKIVEVGVSLVLSLRASKNQILEMYLNHVPLGQRGPFEIHGVAEAARLFFGKDLANLTSAEAATIAGVIQAPSRLSPFSNPRACLDRRNLVLTEMASSGFLTPDAAAKAAKEPLGISTRALENEAPYFVDYVSQQLDDKYKNITKSPAYDVYTTIDLHLQRLAQEALAEGMVEVDTQLASRKKPGHAQAALVAVDPKTGDILAMVGGRSYSESQYNRATVSRRQPGSVFKPFVYLAAFEKVAEDGNAAFTPATVVDDAPTTFMDGDKPYTPNNYENEYDGPITLRQALAHSRNIVAIKVAEATGYDRVADLWKRVGVGTPAKPYPAIALGVFEATPMEIATAYTVFPHAGVVKPLRSILRIVDDGKTQDVPAEKERHIARPDTTFLVTNMMRSVLNEGTGADARADGFTLDAAGKTGTTNDLRDAWFAGFTPDLLTVVWVGFDDNRPIGLTGTQAALPIWTAFMKHALAGHADHAFDVPDGIVFADIDHDTGLLARPTCPKIITEAFLAGTVPTEYCDGHQSGSILARLGSWLARLVGR